MIIDIIRTIARMSMEGIIIIAVILGVRALFKALHISYKFIVPLWIIVFFYLVFPFKIPVENGFWKNIDNIGYAEEVQLEPIFENEKKDENNLEIAGLNNTEYSINDGKSNMVMQAINALNTYADNVIANTPEEKGRVRIIKPEYILEYVWIIAFALFSIKLISSYHSLRKKLDESIPENKNVFLTDNIYSPMVFGIVNPKVYMPFSMDDESWDLVVAHENMHIKRKDNIIKFVAHVIKLIHWFNPFVWLAYNFLSEDIEKACDEAVVSTLDDNAKKKYANALLNIALVKRKQKHTIFEAPVLFDEGNVKGRVKNIMKYKKTLVGLGIFAVCAVTGVGILFSTKDKAEVSQDVAMVEADTNDVKPEETNADNNVSEVVEAVDSDVKLEEPEDNAEQDADDQGEVLTIKANDEVHRVKIGDADYNFKISDDEYIKEINLYGEDDECSHPLILLQKVSCEDNIHETVMVELDNNECLDEGVESIRTGDIVLRAFENGDSASVFVYEKQNDEMTVEEILLEGDSKYLFVGNDKDGKPIEFEIYRDENGEIRCEEK